MQPAGLHFLLTYQCTFECEHCFVWGSPWQSGTMSLPEIRQVLRQAHELGYVTSVAFEGGEPFLYYAILLEAVQEAAALGLHVSLVTNAFWAITEEDALACLRPFTGLVQSITVSSDLFHYNEGISRQVRNASAAAQTLGIETGMISIARVETAPISSGQLPDGESRVMFRGRAAVRLAQRETTRQPWEAFTACPHEDLSSPGRVHLDPLGYIHLCQGIVAGNVYRQPLGEIYAAYQPQEHPITGPLLRGGPAELVRAYGLEHEETYVDACQLCYSARLALRTRYPEVLLPDQMYGKF